MEYVMKAGPRMYAISKNTNKTEDLGIRKHFVKLLLWLFFSTLLALVGLFVGMRSVVPGPAATQTLQANPGENLAISLGLRSNDSISLSLRSNFFKSDSQEFREATENLITDLQRSSGISFERIQTIGHTYLPKDRFISDDSKVVLVQAGTKHSIDSSAEVLKDFHIFIDAWKADYPWLEVNYISQGIIQGEILNLINTDLDQSLIFSLPITFIILVWVFRSIFAALLPLTLAIASLLSSLGVSAIISQVVEPISATSSQLVVLLVLAIGVDYSLFILSRVREEFSKGSSFVEAVDIANSTIGQAIFWSGLTVALSLTGLIFMQDSILTSMAHAEKYRCSCLRSYKQRCTARIFSEFCIQTRARHYCRGWYIPF
jgi:hypothetical protein